MPAKAGAVLPSSILARLPRLDTIKRGTDCSLGGAQAIIEKEMALGHRVAKRVLRQPRRQRSRAHAAQKARSSSGSKTRISRAAGWSSTWRHGILARVCGRRRRVERSIEAASPKSSNRSMGRLPGHPGRQRAGVRAPGQRRCGAQDGRSAAATPGEPLAAVRGASRGASHVHREARSHRRRRQSSRCPRRQRQARHAAARRRVAEE